MATNGPSPVKPCYPKLAHYRIFVLLDNRNALM